MEMELVQTKRKKERGKEQMIGMKKRKRKIRKNENKE
jgi:hypothetical protein